MKTIKDAYEALDGDLGNSWEYRDNVDKFVFWRINSQDYAAFPVRERGYPDVFQYICTVEEFNNYKGDTVKDKMIPFCLEKALAGEKVVTRDGDAVTQFHVFDVNSDSICFGAVVKGKLSTWFVDGHFSGNPEQIDRKDLFMAPKMLSGFINHYYIHHPTWHNSKEQAEIDAKAIGCVKACIDLSQFEEGHGL